MRKPKTIRPKYVPKYSPKREKDDSFYHSSRWRGFKNWYKSKFPMICSVCRGRATELDHITPIEEGGAELKKENIQPLCKPCHSRKTMTEQNKKRWKQT